MVSTAVIGAVVGVLIGVVLLAVLITCIIYISKKLEKKTNTRSKIISTDGRVIKDKWAEDEEVKKYYTGDDDRLYFGHIDKTEHVEVKEKRRREDIYIPPEPAPPQPPPAVAPIVEPPPPVIPVPSPKPHPRLARYRFRSWPKRQRESQTVTRRASIGHAEGVKYFVYGVPYPVNSAPEPTPPAPVAPPQVTPPQVTPPQVTPSAPPVPLVATIENVSPPRKCRSIEEQERVMVIDDTVTEKSFNPRWKADASAYVSDHTTTDVVQTTSISCSCEQQSNRAVPRIVTELL